MPTNSPWLRGPVPGVVPLLQPVAHSLIDSMEDVEERLAGVTTERIWTGPGGAASVGFHVRHAMGSLDRLLTYARAEQLSGEQLEILASEGLRDKGPATAAELIAAFRESIDRAMHQVRGTSEADLLSPREVGRAKLPSNVLGLLFHAAEHTQRHMGQMSSTLKIVA